MTRFESVGADAATHVHARVAAEAKRGVARTASVALPLGAGGIVKLEDDRSHVAVSFALVGTADVKVAVAQGMALYAHALDGADVVHRVHAEGTEDYVVFETRPWREELRYLVDVSHVAGLRLVSNTLEFLDEDSSPGLRIAPPYVVDARGARHDAKLAVSGCVVDANAAAPWGRPVTRPGLERCTVHVTWSDVAYPALVDPAWTATGSMATVRDGHTASVLLSGKVLIAGGKQSAAGFLSSAELFDPAAGGGAGAFAATGAMGTARAGHTASVLASGKVLVAGGFDGGELASAELFDPSANGGAGAFTATGSMVTARKGDHTASVLASGEVLIAGGGAGAALVLSSAELFDPTANGGVGAFTATGSLGTMRLGHAASVLASGKVLVVGGRLNVGGGPAGVLFSAELFDRAGNGGAGAFVATGSMATSRTAHTASVLASGKVLVAGEGAMGPVASAELFDPAANGGVGAFAATGSMGTSRSSHTASVLATAKVLVTGGVAPPLAYLSGAEVFDPAANGGAGAFAAAGTMTMSRAGHTASVLASGKVLVAGGAGAGGALLASAELFDLVAAGGACGVAGECVSNICDQGVCCAGACAGTCKKCVAGTGACGSVTNADDPDTCHGTSTCDASGACKCLSDPACAAGEYCANGTCKRGKGLGEACSTACISVPPTPGCQECASGDCVDGFCCNTACMQQCEACNIVPGTCKPVSGAPVGKRPACSQGSTCMDDRSGTGDSRCETPTGATCDGDHTTTGADGKRADCAPYKCDSNGSCKATCSTVNDCVDPSLCDSTGKCILAPGAETGSGACSVTRATGSTHGPSPLALTLLTLLAFAARRRRGCNSGN